MDSTRNAKNTGPERWHYPFDLEEEERWQTELETEEDRSRRPQVRPHRKRKRNRKLHAYCGAYNYKCHRAALNIEKLVEVRLEHREFAVLSMLALHMNIERR